MNRMAGLLPAAAAAFLIGVGGLVEPAWGNGAEGLRVAQATTQEEAGLDAEKVKQLDAEGERLYEVGKYAEATAIAERSLAWKEVNLGQEHPDTAARLNNLTGPTHKKSSS